MNRLQYYLARFLGGTSGTNSPEMATMAIIDDIRRSKEDIKVVTCSAGMNYWNEDVINALRDKKEERPELTIEFIVGPEFSNSGLGTLENEGALSILHLKEKPPCDCRIIDFSDTYASNHGGNGRERKYCWTFGNKKAFDDRIRYYSKLKWL